MYCRFVASDQGADMLDHLAAANPVSLCVPMACEEDKQPTRAGLGWKAPDVWLWLTIGQ
uniref:Amidase domain-containing protein n=1 Tax=Mesocestoides corti TaxID=53468 RepID=A0A5K3F4G9_MESCO